MSRPTTYSRHDILSEALKLSHEIGYNKVTREVLSKRASCSPAQISHMFGTILHLHRAIISAAIARKDLIVLAQGLAFNHAKAIAAPQELKVLAAGSLV